jgi:hypothetical protein
VTLTQLLELCEWLAGPEGINVCEARAGDPSSTTWNCDGELTKTTQWLRAHGLPVEESLDYLGGQGAGCDCEVLWNAGEAAG